VSKGKPLVRAGRKATGLETVEEAELPLSGRDKTGAVILIIGILAAIALPTFLGQSKKGQDASAKSDVRNAVSQMESCYTTTSTYIGCPDTESPLAQGVVASGQSATGYIVTQVSKSNTSFVITKNGTTGAYTRTCAPVGGGCHAVDSSGNGW
jgi:type IV pilus assembly protein PilA